MKAMYLCSSDVRQYQGALIQREVFKATPRPLDDRTLPHRLQCCTCRVLGPILSEVTWVGWGPMATFSGSAIHATCSDCAASCWFVNHCLLQSTIT
jgi:hypothetical protein